MTRSLLAIEFFFILSGICAADESSIRRDIEYARVGDHTLLLDLYLPAEDGPHPLIVWVHGGAWREQPEWHEFTDHDGFVQQSWPELHYGLRHLPGVRS